MPLMSIRHPKREEKYVKRISGIYKNEKKSKFNDHYHKYTGVSDHGAPGKYRGSAVYV